MTGAQTNILIVEDDDALRDALLDTATIAGFTASGAAHGRAALEDWLPQPTTPADADIVAEDSATKQVFELARRVAASDASIMIIGESGVGKEVVFRAIHRASRRTRHTPVALNCAAIPENMLEAVLFGYEKGAFTGAYKACPGKFEQAQDSSLLLDEVSEMPLGLQAKLLRVLQERKVERLGSQQLIDLDVRIIATTNCDLRMEVEAGRFREDLFYRLNVMPLYVPPLRDRQADVIPLAVALLRRAAAKTNITPPELSRGARAVARVQVAGERARARQRNTARAHHAPRRRDRRRGSELRGCDVGDRRSRHEWVRCKR